METGGGGGRVLVGGCLPQVSAFFVDVQKAGDIHPQASPRSLPAYTFKHLDNMHQGLLCPISSVRAKDMEIKNVKK